MTTLSHTKSHPKKILFQLSGSVAIFKACQVISRLVQLGFDVKTVATKSALRFIGPATLEGLTGHPVETDVFAKGQAMQHIQLQRWADLILLAPATASTLNKLAAGIGDDLVSTLFLAHDFKKPYWVVPAMNSSMLLHPTTQTSLITLKKWGIEVLESPEPGPLACGEEGWGRFLEPEKILAHIEDYFQSYNSTNLVGSSAPPPQEILITLGGTREPLDQVRYLSNISTGQTGWMLAQTLAAQHYQVTVLHGQGVLESHLHHEFKKTQTQFNSNKINFVSFSTFCDLDEKLKSILAERHFYAILHLAAVSDFSVDHVTTPKGHILDGVKKLDSRYPLTLHMKTNHKILPRLKEYAHHSSPLVIGFKLTSGATPEEATLAVHKINKNVDLLVHNDTTAISENQHRATFYENGAITHVTQTKQELAKYIINFLQRHPCHPFHVPDHVEPKENSL